MAETRLPAPVALMTASGFAGLAYEIVWTQQNALWLGQETAAVLATLAAFFGGLALGALSLAPAIGRSSRPARWYAGCEAAIGAWSAVLALLMPRATVALLGVIGAEPSPAWQWAVTFCGTFLLLLPATAAMGATLPAMERMLTQTPTGRSRIGTLYAANTAGAVLGVLAAAFWLVPHLGLTRTALVCVPLNLLCAGIALALLDKPAVPAIEARPPGRTSDFAMLAITGLLGIGYEVLGFRVLSQVAENTVFTFAVLLAVYLVGTAAGAAIYQRWVADSRAADGRRERLLRLTAVACLAGIAGMAAAGTIKASILRFSGVPSLGLALAAEAGIAISALLLPTIAMGMLFTHLCMHARAAGMSFGRALGINTLGAAIAPLLFGVLLIPAIGLRLALLGLAGAYLLLSAGRKWRSVGFAGTSIATLSALVWMPALTFVDVPEGGRVLDLIEGRTATVSVVADAGGVARLHIDNRQQEGSSGTRFADARQALLPMLLHPAPHRALFLGLGTGITASSAAESPGLDVDAVELLPEVITASALFRRAFAEAAQQRLHLLHADARRFVRTSQQHYDLIVADNFHPARSGASALYTVEHFAAIRVRLATGGVFCQWLPLHQLDLQSLRSITRAFLTVYPRAAAILATNSLDTPVLGLVAHRDGEHFQLQEPGMRLSTAALPVGYETLGLSDEFAVSGSFIASASALARFAGDAPANTDDRPIVAYRAPRITYVPDSLPRDRLIALLDKLYIVPAELQAGSTDGAWQHRLAAYWAARNQFINAGRNVTPTPAARDMLQQVREPLLAVLKTSPDFRPAYDPLLRMALALGHEDLASARRLLEQLRDLQPARPEAARALAELGGALP